MRPRSLGLYLLYFLLFLYIFHLYNINSTGIIETIIVIVYKNTYYDITIIFKKTTQAYKLWPRRVRMDSLRRYFCGFKSIYYSYSFFVSRGFDFDKLQMYTNVV